MYLIECFNNERTKNCSALYNKESNYTIRFNTSLEEVAMTESDDNLVELRNESECYCIPYEDSLKNIWGIE